MSARKPYTGILRQRLPKYPLKPDALFAPHIEPAKYEERLRQWHAAVTQRMQALARHFGVAVDSEDFWQELALRLAMRHVPGFKVTKERLGRKVGRPRSRERRAAQYDALLTMRNASSLSDEGWCKWVIRTPSQRKLLPEEFRGISVAGTLRQELIAAKKARHSRMVVARLLAQVPGQQADAGRLFGLTPSQLRDLVEVSENPVKK